MSRQSGSGKGRGKGGSGKGKATAKAGTGKRKAAGKSGPGKQKATAKGGSGKRKAGAKGAAAGPKGGSATRKAGAGGGSGKGKAGNGEATGGKRKPTDSGKGRGAGGGGATGRTNHSGGRRGGSGGRGGSGSQGGRRSDGGTRGFVATRQADGEGQAPTRVAVITRRGRGLTGEPIYGPGPRRPIDTGGRDAERPAEGDLVLLPPPDRDRSGRARIERKIGRIEIAGDVIEGLMLERGLERGFPGRVEAEARSVATAIDPSGRVDLRELVTFTIDPKSARDFDDAISAEEIAGGRTRVWVHIADVSAFVRPGSALDEEARSRATSVYVPGRVEPMLPHSLSSGACSLVPGEDRLAVTVRMDFDGPDCVAAELMRTVIRSDQRLDYDEVDRILLGEVAAREPWAKPLAAARAVAKALAQRASERHALALDRPEPEFMFDDEGSVSGWRQVEQTESHRLIEMLMVAANSQVAKMLVERKAPALHRVHERPDPAKVELLLDRLASLEIPTPPAPERMSPGDAVRLASEASVLVDHWTRREQRGRLGITTLVLRALQQARYDPQPLGHSGLGLEHYCHFTSPIRRYPDIVCHRAILSSLGLGEERPSAAAMAELGEWTSAREREAMVIERDADDIARCFLLAKEIHGDGPTVFDGEIVGVISAGLFVDFGGGFEGFLPARRMRGEWWEVNSEQTMLVAGSGRRLRLGDPIVVEVGRVDCPRGRCDLYPVSGRD